MAVPHLGTDLPLEARLAGLGETGECPLAQDGPGCIELGDHAAGRFPPAPLEVPPLQRLGTHPHPRPVKGDQEGRGRIRRGPGWRGASERMSSSIRSPSVSMRAPTSPTSRTRLLTEGP